MPRTRKNKQSEGNDQSSLLTEIRQLRDELNDLRQGGGDQALSPRGQASRTSQIQLPPARQPTARQSQSAYDCQEEPLMFEPAPAIRPAISFSSPKCELPKFDGSGSLKKFQARFRDTCIINNWHSQEEKGIWLKMCLESRARDILHDETQDFDSLMQRLQVSFGDHLLRKRFEMSLPSRRRKPNEPLLSLAHDIRNMTDIVYEDLDRSTRERMAIRHFIMAIESPSAQYELARSSAETLDEIVSIAQTREMYFGQESAWQKNSQPVNLGPSNPSPRPSAPKCKHCGGNHPSYVCLPCRHCGGGHYDNQCSRRQGNSQPVANGPSATGKTQSGP